MLERMINRRAEITYAFGLTLVTLRRGAGQTQETLADRCSLHVTYISQLERGTKAPSLVTLIAIADALGLTATDLMQAIESALRRP